MSRGFSLVAATGVVLLLFTLSMVALNTATSSAFLKGGMHAQTIAFNAAESGFYGCGPTLLESGEGNFIDLLDPEATCDAPANFEYDVGVHANYSVQVLDNDDLDGNTSVDNDRHVIVISKGQMFNGVLEVGRIEVGVIMKFKGGGRSDPGDSAGAAGTSQVKGEINVNDDLGSPTVGNPNT